MTILCCTNSPGWNTDSQGYRWRNTALNRERLFTMSIQLKNEYLCLDIQEPGNPYKGSRFDWTGQIIQITFMNKHTFCTTENPDVRLQNKLGRGLYNEFGIDQPIAYYDCPVGDKFHKVGVGLLTRTSTKPYDFFENYEVMPYTFSYSVNKSKTQFLCRDQNYRKYTFQLEKRIELEENTLTIHYALTNHGEKTIRTNEYVHNFLAINNKKIDSHYKLIFPFSLKPDQFGAVVNPHNSVRIDDHFITWHRTPDRAFYFSNINSGYMGKGIWTLIHDEDRVGIQESSDFNIQKMNLWGNSHVVSPEIFFEIEVLQGKTITWSRTYTLFSLN